MGKKKGKLLAGSICLILCLSGCGSSSKGTAAYSANNTVNFAAQDNGGIYMEESEYPAGELYDAEESGTAENVRAGRKLIKTVNMTVETLEFDKLLDHVEGRTKELGGYVESMNVYNGSSYNSYNGYGYNGYGYRNDRSADMILRIPKDKLDGFLTEVAENSNIINRSEQEKDVTLDYVDLDSHKAALLAEQERLLALMERAESIEDLITLESRLSDIRYQIESMESQLRTFDNQIEYSTIYLSISEVVELTPVEVVEKTTWERIGEGFMDSLDNIGTGLKEFFIWFVTAIPYLVLFAVIVLVIVWIIIASVKRSAARKRKRMEQMQQAYIQQMQNAQQMQAVQNMQQMQNGQAGVSQTTENRGQ